VCHEEHLVIDPLSGALIMCCARHDTLFEERCRRQAPPVPRRESLGTAAEQYIAQRLGGHPRDFPVPWR
jgi:hypothetical protein